MRFSPIWAASAGADPEGFGAAFNAEALYAEQAGLGVGDGVPTVLRPAAPVPALVGLPCFLRHDPTGTFFTPCMLWQYTTSPGVTDVVYGPLLTSTAAPPALAQAGPFVPVPVAVPGVSTLESLVVTSWTSETPPFQSLGLPTVVNPPALSTLPSGFFVATLNAVTGTPGVVVPLPAPFDVLDLSIDAVIQPVGMPGALAGKSVADSTPFNWRGAMP